MESRWVLSQLAACPAGPDPREETVVRPRIVWVGKGHLRMLKELAAQLRRSGASGCDVVPSLRFVEALRANPNGYEWAAEGQTFYAVCPRV